MFNGSKWRQQTRKPSHFGSHSASEPRIFRGLLGDFDPHTSYLGTKKYPSFTKSRICGGLKKRPPSYAKYVTGVQPPSTPECPPVRGNWRRQIHSYTALLKSTMSIFHTGILPGGGGGGALGYLGGAHTLVIKINKYP